MAKTLVTDYVFAPATRALTINGFGNTPSKFGLTSVRNATTGETYYLASMEDQISISGKVVTLPFGVITLPANSTDELIIYFDPDLTDPDAEPASPPAIEAEATDPETTMALANDIRQKLIDLGIVSE